MTKTNDIKIECPKCGTDNAIPQTWDLICLTCEAPLKSGKYSKRFISVWAALAIGAGGTIGVDQMFKVDRYPIKVEHTIIEDCINRSRIPMTNPDIVKKREVCICALSKTQNDFDAEPFDGKKLKHEFSQVFAGNAVQCIINQK
ncbi:MAG: hypothetical protein JKY92_08345 [Magnetovibrio sp.]|nr:hypothetical protein [Magnetovibrio sp.]